MLAPLRAKHSGEDVEYYERDLTQTEGRVTDYMSEQGEVLPQVLVPERQGASEAERESLRAGVRELIGVEAGQRLEASEVRNWLTEHRSIDGVAMLGRRPAKPHRREMTASDPEHRRGQIEGMTAEQASEAIASEGRSEGRAGVLFYDMTTAAPKWLSVIFALTEDDEVRRQCEEIVRAGADASLAYLAEHAGYSRTRRDGELESIRCSFAGVRYQHRTSRAGDPHLHVHDLISNKQVCEDGVVRALDGTAFHHEYRAAGIVGQFVMEAMAVERFGIELGAVDEASSVSEFVGIDEERLREWSQRRTEMDEWAAAHGISLAGAGGEAAQKATRAAKESQPLDQSLAEWQADPRAQGIDMTPGAGVLGRVSAVDETAAEIDAIELHPATVLSAIARERSTFTRSDVVEAVSTLLSRTRGGAATALELIESETDRVLAFEQAISLDMSGDSEVASAGMREGSRKFSTAAVLAEESRAMQQASSWSQERAVLVSDEQIDALFGERGGQSSQSQRAAVASIARSGNSLTPLVAPAGAGKTSGVMAPLAELYRREGRRVLGAATNGAAADVMRQEGVVDSSATVASYLSQLAEGRLTLDAQTVLLLDEAGMTGNGELAQLIAAAEAGGGKIVAVGDPEQLSPVKARGGLFADLVAECPDAVELDEVFRQQNAEERAAGLALRDGSGEQVAAAADWYAAHGRLHAGSTAQMADDALRDWTQDRAQGFDSLLVVQDRATCDTLNKVAQQEFLAASRERWAQANASRFAGGLEEAREKIAQVKPRTARLSKDGMQHEVAVGEPIITRQNLYQSTTLPDGSRGEVVRNGNRWTVAEISDRGAVRAIRKDDGASIWLSADYLDGNAHLGYAGTVHSVQGATCDFLRGVLNADTADRHSAYVALTRGRMENHLYLFTPVAGEAAEEHRRERDAEEAPSWAKERQPVAEARDALVKVASRDGADRTASATIKDERRKALLADPDARIRRDRKIAEGQVTPTPAEAHHRAGEERKSSAREQFEERMRRISEQLRQAAERRAADQSSDRGLSL